MRVLIAAAGKAKSSPEQQLYFDYIKRLKWKVALSEVKSGESDKLLAACKGYARIVALDESGKTLSSREFAETLKKWQLQGDSSVAFVIGGADGLDKKVLERADLTWSLGRVTWPHMLVRALLAEQIYRAWSLLNNHPYHRE